LFLSSYTIYWPKGDDDYNGNNNSDNNGFVDFNGDYFKIKNAKLYTPPSSGKIPLYMAAVGEQATKIAARYTDGLITITKPDKSRDI
jgi:coenzyme F420-dependent glucose-6-phosphate dehydrogenase